LDLSEHQTKIHWDNGMSINIRYRKYGQL
jgi:hypothetical protein